MMQTVIQNLHASAPQALSFAPSTHVRAFLLERKEGNLLVYNTAAVADDARAIGAQGGVARHYLNHWHEAGFGCDRVATALQAPIFCHENERPAVSKTCAVAETFSERHVVGDDFEVIPTPGHTGGATAFLWDSGQHRCLFTGDTVYLHEGDWIAAVLESSDRDAYIESLELIKGLDFDVLVPWAATAGQPFHAVTAKSDARRRIAAIVRRLRQGADH
jgi:glyoxylase-like metal-dependent hydrolase (beta-lactamase superfamily II)